VLDPETVVRRLWQAINDRDYSRLAGAIAERCDWVSVPSERHYRGPGAMVDGLRRFHESFPDGRADIVALYTAGDAVIVEWRVSGTNTGGDAPTGRSFARRGCSVAVVRGGKIVEYRDYFDRLTLTEQLGQAPAASAPPGRAAAGSPSPRPRPG
jgi:ketosteroid isomerase-like protein